MPPGISPGDRKILTIAGVAFLLLVLLGFLFAPAGHTDSHSASSYSTTSEGAKAAYLLLQQLGYHVERWQHPPTSLTPAKHTVLIIADPEVMPNEKQRASLEQFVSGGGRIIATGIFGARFMPEDSSEYNPLPSNPQTEFNALAPSAITRAAPKITLAPVAKWSQTSGISVYGDEDQTVVTRYPHGEGDAIWMASATPFTNAGIKQPNNLEFLLAAIGDKQQTRVLFDEYVHGFGERETSEKSHPLAVLLPWSLWKHWAASISRPMRPRSPWMFTTSASSTGSHVGSVSAIKRRPKISTARSASAGIFMMINSYPRCGRLRQPAIIPTFPRARRSKSCSRFMSML